MSPAAPPEHPLVETHEGVLREASAALSTRGFHSRYPDSPSPRLYPEGTAEAGAAAYERRLNRQFSGLAGQPTDGAWVGDEVSPFGPRLGVSYPRLDVPAALEAASTAMRPWREAGPRVRAAVCVEIIDRVNAGSFELAHAVMHTSGQPFVMAFQAGGPNAQDRALEAVAAALVEQERVPERAVWERPGRGGPVRMEKDYHVVPRGIGLVIGCNTFPTWNAYPGLFASLACGNAVIVKPHPRAVLPLAITVEVARSVLAQAGFDPALVQLAAEGEGGRLAADLAMRPEVALVDYTGGPAFGHWLVQQAGGRGASVFAEMAGVNTVVVDSTDDLAGMLANLAFSLTLYTGQMCTTPQNLYVPRDGVVTDEGRLTFTELGARLSAAIDRLTGDASRAVELLGATVNDRIRATADGVRTESADAAGDDLERDGSAGGGSERAEAANAGSASAGLVVRSAAAVTHPVFPEAECRTPGLVALDVADVEVYTQERFGPVTFLIATDSTRQSLERLVTTVREHGAMTASVYSTSPDVLAAARSAALDAGVSLSENLTGEVFVNQTSAFSDFHGTGANPAANAAYTDAAFVTPRFRIVTTRRHLPD